MAKKTETMVTFVLDETGSMNTIKDDTIGGFNSYLETLKAGKNPIRFTLLKFDSNRTEKVCVDIPVKDVLPLTPETYQPGAMTPLIDACYKAIIATAEKVAEKKMNVAIVIQTDGYENASTQYTTDDLAALVKEKTALGWAFTFLGAGIDAFGQARQFGIASAQTVTYDRDKSAQAFHAAAQSTTRYAATGATLDAAFTSAERQSTGGHMPSGATPTDKTLSNVTSAARRVQGRKPIVDDISL